MDWDDAAEEQAYLELVLEACSRSVVELSRPVSAGDDYAEELIDRIRAERAELLRAAARVPYFGRIDRDGKADYIGVGAVWDADDELLVINWRAPSAAAFYEAAPERPLGVQRRRRLTVDPPHVVAIEDEWLDGRAPFTDLGLAAAVRAVRAERSSRMRHIVSTIRPDQYALICDDRRGVLVVQGGPGTGKTAVGLHRAAWLMFQHADIRARSVLVVGPNRAFLDYVQEVLPTLGERTVVQRTIAESGPLQPTVAERDPRVAAIKGSSAMATVIAGAVRSATTAPVSDVELRIGSRSYRLRGTDLRSDRREAFTGDRSHAAARTRFGELVRRRLRGQIAARTGLDSDEIDRLVRREPGVKQALDDVVPALSARRLVADLWKSPERLRAAAGGALDEEEIALLTTSPRRQPTVSDVPLIAEAAAVVDGPERRYGHVVVDEAQELSPMAIRMLSHLAAAGSMTILGDLAQCGREPPTRSWSELTGGLDPIRVHELSVSYRVPRQFIELAATLLGDVGADVSAPTGVHEAERPVELQRFGAAGPRSLIAAWIADRGKAGGTLGVVAPTPMVASLLRQATVDDVDLRNGMDCSEGAARVFAPATVKGLEFDHVLVVEPARILVEPSGSSALYVALTRSTRTLAIAHREPLPASFSEVLATATR